MFEELSNAQMHLQRSHFFMANQHSEITVIFSKTQNAVRNIKVDETELTLRNVFIFDLFDLFALGGKKCRSPWPSKDAYMRLSGPF